MRAIQSMLLCLSLSSAAALGCSSPVEMSPVGTSQARLIVSMQGSESARFKVTAVNVETAEIAFDQAIDVEGSQASIVDLSIAPASYTFHVEAFADASMQTSLGSGETHAELAAGASTDIKLNAQVSDTDADGKGDQASVTVNVNVAPKIEGVEVQMAGQAGGSLAAGGEIGATLHVKAVDAEGGALTYVWTGAGLEGAVQGSDTLVISAETAAALAASGAGEIYVVVADDAGATAQAAVTLTFAAAGDSAGGSSSVDTSVEGSASVQACLDAQAQCGASCDAALAAAPLALSAHAACIAQCSLKLATCSAD